MSNRTPTPDDMSMNDDNFDLPDGLADAVEAGLNVPPSGLGALAFPPLDDRRNPAAHCYDGPWEGFRKAKAAVDAMGPPSYTLKFRRDANLIRTLEQFRFPRTKRVRIQKKWRNDPRNWHTIPAMFHMADGTVLCDPETFADVTCHLLDLGCDLEVPQDAMCAPRFPNVP